MSIRRNGDDDFLEEEWTPHGRDDDADDWEVESPQEEDELIDCPECGAAIHGESQRCPQCGHYIIDDDDSHSRLWQGRPWWWLVLGGLGIVALIYALSRP